MSPANPAPGAVQALRTQLKKQRGREMQNNQRITGWPAIDFAEAHGLTVLSKYADPVEGARDDLTLSEAREIAMQNPSLIYIEVKS